jgi:hypothetical protein
LQPRDFESAHGAPNSWKSDSDIGAIKGVQQDVYDLLSNLFVIICREKTFALKILVIRERKEIEISMEGSEDG